jgi:site-specific recombinase XerD
MDKKQLSEVVLSFIKRYENLNTQESYLADLSCYIKFFKSKNLMDFKIDYQLASEYVEFLKTMSLSRSTYARKLIVVRKFYGFLRGLAVVDHNPFEALRIPSVDKTSKTRNIDDEIIMKLLAMVEDDLKNKIIMYFLIFHGMRVSEVAGIKIENLCLDDEIPYIIIEGKRDKKRKHPLRKDMIPVIKKFMSIEECDDYLLPGQGTLHIHRQTIWNLIKYLSSIVGVHLHPHQFRHYAITKALNNGMTIKQVKEFAGHGDINTTDRYDRTIQNLKDSPVLKISESLNRKSED